jgi:DNA-binding NtrC family response regulator
MIEDSRDFFAAHACEETRRRGLALVALVTGLRDCMMGGGTPVILEREEAMDMPCPTPPALPLGAPTQAPQPRKYKTIAEAERELTLETLARTRGDVPKAAKHLHISRNTIYARLNEWRISPAEFRKEL